ncbi:protein BREVIS RADIX-like isoform X1 [Zingiber officinale]|uniref:protein BREVIS RADIX-like isoform X1 n=1 Tax=Zingiber officinale TaxID=94328 RepID=UPI001C4C134E|nr:protein BREVIS RADIX-like isoform X1 [Zingiber officinale]XP_042412610.1 protein BREVIS RADIX-like isoform X1 [Zingiber officinale]
MLACIACAKQDPDDGGEGGGARSSGKEAVKSLSSQIKDMVLKISGSVRQSKGSGSSSSFSSKSFRSKSFRSDPRHRGDPRRWQQQRPGAYTYEDAAHYAAAASSSTATWDLMEEKQQDVHDHDHDEPKEWVAQVEPGVHITFVSLPGGAGNDLKRIRFSREMFNKWQAQRWWGENYDRIMELYNVQRYNRQALQTPARSDDGGERESSWSRVGSTKESPITTEQILIRDTYKPASAAYDKGAQTPSPVLPHRLHSPSCAMGGAGASGVKAEASRTTTSSRDEASVSASNASDLETTEWVEQDEPGVYITIRELADGTRELRRVRFSREKFGEVHAKLWWEANRERIHAQYL